MNFFHEARRHPGAWIDIEKPFWWDVPIWLASGRIDSIDLANNHMSRSQMYESEASGKPRDSKRFPPPKGNGYWSQEIYYHILDCGLRIPPSAGSASGVIPNPVGYNRVYVHVGKAFCQFFRRPVSHKKGFKVNRCGCLTYLTGGLNILRSRIL